MYRGLPVVGKSVVPPDVELLGKYVIEAILKPQMGAMEFASEATLVVSNRANAKGEAQGIVEAAVTLWS
jgi:hypothetical protein